MAESYAGCHLNMYKGPYVTVANDQFFMMPMSYGYNDPGHLMIRLTRRDVVLRKTCDDNFTDTEADMDAFRTMDYFLDGRAELVEDFVSGEIFYEFHIPPLLKYIPLYRRVFFAEAVSSLGIDDEVYDSLREMLVNKFETYSDALLDHDVGHQFSLVAELLILKVDFADPSDLQLFQHIDYREDAMSSADDSFHLSIYDQDDTMSTTDS